MLDALALGRQELNHVRLGVHSVYVLGHRPRSPRLDTPGGVATLPRCWCDWVPVGTGVAYRGKYPGVPTISVIGSLDTHGPPRPRRFRDAESLEFGGQRLVVDEHQPRHRAGQDDVEAAQPGGCGSARPRRSRCRFESTTESNSRPLASPAATTATRGSASSSIALASMPPARSSAAALRSRRRVGDDHADRSRRSARQRRTSAITSAPGA